MRYQSRQRREGTFQLDDDRPVTGFDLDDRHLPEHARLLVGAVQCLRRANRIGRRVVVEAHALAQREGPAQLVFGDRSMGRETGTQRALGVGVDEVLNALQLLDGEARLRGVDARHLPGRNDGDVRARLCGRAAGPSSCTSRLPSRPSRRRSSRLVVSTSQTRSSTPWLRQIGPTSRSIGIGVVGLSASDDPRHDHARSAGSHGIHPRSPLSLYRFASNAPQTTSAAPCAASAST